MVKNLRLLLPTAAILLLAAPAAAQATTGLTEGGSLVPVGAKILLTNVGNTVVTSAKTGNVSCTQWKFTLEVTTNTTAEFDASGFGTGSNAGGCSVPSGAVVTVPSVTMTDLKTTGEVVSGSTKKAIGNLAFEIKIGSLTCKYTTSTGVATYVAGGSSLTFSEQPLTVTPAACGTTAKLDGTWRYETEDGTALVLD